MLLLLLLADLPPATDLLPRSDEQLVGISPVPLLTGRPGKWDVAIRERGWIVREDGRYRLWYTGYDGTRRGIKRIGHAVSDDGVRWTRQPDGPITPEGLWVEDVCVVRDGSRYQMFAEGRGDQAHRLSSDDGLDWNPEGPLDVRLTDGSTIPPGPYGTPCVVRDGDSWVLLYERRDAGVWVARSPDMDVWTNVSDDPVFEPSGEGWDAKLIAFNQVLRTRDGWLAVYHGTDRLQKPRLWAVGVATSSDLLSWTRLRSRPLTPPVLNMSSGVVVLDTDDGVRWFTTHSRVDQIGVVEN